MEPSVDENEDDDEDNDLEPVLNGRSTRTVDGDEDAAADKDNEIASHRVDAEPSRDAFDNSSFCWTASAPRRQKAAKHSCRHEGQNQTYAIPMPANL